MVYTTGSTATVNEVGAKGSAIIASTAASQYAVVIADSTSTELFNPTAVTVIQPTVNTNSSITTASIPLTNQYSVDLDVDTVAITTVDKVAVCKVVPAIKVQI
jgi:hypothetical protein